MTAHRGIISGAAAAPGPDRLRVLAARMAYVDLNLGQS